MSKVYEFAISRKVSVVVALCCTLAAILLFVAGTLSGFLLFPRYNAYAQPKTKEMEVSTGKLGSVKPAAVEPTQLSCGTPPASAAPPASGVAAPPTTASASLNPAAKLEAPAQPSAIAEVGKSASAAKEAASLAAGAGTSQTAGTDENSATGTPGGATSRAASAASVSAKAVVPPPPDPYVVSLVVQVGSFIVEENANKLAESLRQLGYQPEIVERTDSRQRVWHVVRLGPYRQWNAASVVAMRLAANQDLKPIVGPM